MLHGVYNNAVKPILLQTPKKFYEEMLQCDTKVHHFVIANL